MSRWESVPLGRVVDFYAGSSLPPGEPYAAQVGGYFLLKVSDMNLPGNEIFIEICQEWSANPGQRSATCPADSVVIPKRGGAIGTNKKRITPRPSVLDPNLMAISPHRDKVDLRFLYQWFQSFDLASITSGSSVPQLNKRDLDPLPFPLPAFEEQRRIAEVLDRADELRTKRRQALAHLDDLTQSIFIDMFGNPVNNDRHWPEVTVNDFVARFESGKNLVAEDEEDPTARYRVLKVSAVTSLTFKATESKAVPSDYVPPSSHIVREGDLLFSRANTVELIGATAIATGVKGNLLLPDKLWRFVWHDSSKATPLYVRQLFRQPAFRHEISRRATGTSGSMKNISQEKVLSIRCGMPPIHLQHSFDKRISSVERLKEAHRESLAELDALFASLQDRAFKGLL